MRYITMLVLILAVVTSCSANDTVMIGVGGSLRPMIGEHSSVRMVREWVRMDVYPTYYDVAVQFVFKNNGPAAAVRMGFPEFNSGGISPSMYREKSGYRSFLTTVDGRRVSAERIFLDDPEAEYRYRAYWVKTVPFSRGQERVIRVEYRSEGGYDSMGNRFAEYNFTGRNWAGMVDESSIVAVMHMPGSYHIQGLPAGAKMVGNRFSARWTDWQADREFGFAYSPTYEGAMLLQGDALGFETRNEFFLKQPGRTQSPAWVPDVIMRNGAAFIRMQSLRSFLDGRSRKYNLDSRPSKKWDPQTQTVTFDTPEHQLIFRVGQQEMQADGRTVTLSAAPFRMPGNRYTGSSIYVPLRPVADALGATVSVDTKARVVRLDMPM